MTIQLNGEKKTVEAKTVAELVAELGLAGKAVAVERNGEVIPKRQHAETTLAEGDALELVTLVGGG